MRLRIDRNTLVSSIVLLLLGACAYEEGRPAPDLKNTNLDSCTIDPNTGTSTCTTCTTEYEVACDPETADDPTCADIPDEDWDVPTDDGSGGGGPLDGGVGGYQDGGTTMPRDAGFIERKVGAVAMSNVEIIYVIIRPVTSGLWTGYLEGYIYQEGLGRIGDVFRSTRPAMSGGRLVDEAAWREMVDRGRTLGQQHAARMPNLNCRVRVMTVGIRFAVAAIVMLAYTGYVDAAQSAANRIIPQWEAFYGNCSHIGDWFIKVNTPLNSTTARSCRDCYNYYFPAPGTGAISICTDGQGQEVYNGLRDDIGARGYRRAEGCAALPGGYYSQRFTAPLFRPDAPNVPTIDATCPY
jgi:hypothetical protein